MKNDSIIIFEEWIAANYDSLYKSCSQHWWFDEDVFHQAMDDEMDYVRRKGTVSKDYWKRMHYLTKMRYFDVRRNKKEMMDLDTVTELLSSTSQSSGLLDEVLGFISQYLSPKHSDYYDYYIAYSKTGLFRNYTLYKKISLMFDVDMKTLKCMFDEVEELLHKLHKSGLLDFDRD